MSKLKVVFVSFPMSSDIYAYAAMVVKISHGIQVAEIVAVFPDFQRYQSRNKEELRPNINEAHLQSRFVEELWLYGSHLTGEMRMDIQLARKHGIPVVPKSRGTANEYLKGKSGPNPAD